MWLALQETIAHDRKGDLQALVPSPQTLTGPRGWLILRRTPVPWANGVIRFIIQLINTAMKGVIALGTLLAICLSQHNFPEMIARARKGD